MVEPLKASLLDAVGFERVSTCDIVFGCMDTAEGRHILGKICSAYAIPLFDVGVHIEPDGAGGMSHAVAAAHYIQPGGSSLLSRGVYSGEISMRKQPSVRHQRTTRGASRLDT